MPFGLSSWYTTSSPSSLKKPCSTATRQGRSWALLSPCRRMVVDMPFPRNGIARLIIESGGPAPPHRLLPAQPPALGYRCRRRRASLHDVVKLHHRRGAFEPARMAHDLLMGVAVLVAVDLG